MMLLINVEYMRTIEYVENTNSKVQTNLASLQENGTIFKAAITVMVSYRA